MGHYHTEIVMPKTDNVEAAITEIMAPFDENDVEDHDGGISPYAFWDYWTTGGRWSGYKLQSTLDPDTMENFYKTLREREVTISGAQWGKQELDPADQIPMVDALWHELFPNAPEGPCPIFKHSGDRGKQLIEGDLMPFMEVPRSLTMERLIFAARDHLDNRWEPAYMIQGNFYNGVNLVETSWDTTFGQGVDMFTKKYSRGAKEYRDRVAPTPDSVVITVDYHS